MFCGTESPTVSGASFRALGKPRSFTFSFIVKRCSWVKLMVRGSGGIAGLLSSSARTSSGGDETVTPIESTAEIRKTRGYRPIHPSSKQLFQ
jgi:hypothetical protein